MESGLVRRSLERSRRGEGGSAFARLSLHSTVLRALILSPVLYLLSPV